MSDTCVTDNLHPTQRLQSDADTLEPSGQTSAEFGDIDNSQNSIDGMGAIKFTDEKDCGFFGMRLATSQFECETEIFRAFV